MPLPDDEADPWAQRSTDGPGDGRSRLDCAGRPPGRLTPERSPCRGADFAVIKCGRVVGGWDLGRLTRSLWSCRRPAVGCWPDQMKLPLGEDVVPRSRPVLARCPDPTPVRRRADRGARNAPPGRDGAWMLTWRSPSHRGWDVRLSDRSAAHRAAAGGTMPPARDRAQTGGLVVRVGAGP